MLIHGGPQGAWGHSWTYRWNAQVFAAAGYLVVMPNPRGSTGYGQKFIDEINDDWGGRAFDDIMAVTDHVATLPYADASRMAAAGGSYGGYMVNWILGHTAALQGAGLPRRRLRPAQHARRDRRAVVPALGVRRHALGQARGRTRAGRPACSSRSSAPPPWSSTGNWISACPTARACSSSPPCNCRRCPPSCSSIPDEGHWIIKPQNSLLWYKTFIDWIDTWTKK